MRKLFLSLVFLSVLLSIHANPGIKGIVIDQTTRKALDYAHVVLYDGDHIVEEAMTEANGSFLIQPVKPGTYSIRIHFLGYDVYMGEEFILTEQIKDLGIIPMQMLEVGLQEVEVVANKKQADDKKLTDEAGGEEEDQNESQGEPASAADEPKEEALTGQEYDLQEEKNMEEEEQTHDSDL